MHYFFYTLLLCIQLTSLNLFAATYEINLAEFFPQQNFIHKMQFEAEFLLADITMTNGCQINALSCEQLPSPSEITHLSLIGPEVSFKVITSDGNEWIRSMSSFNLQISNEIVDRRKEMTLELYATPLDRLINLNDNVSESLNFVSDLFKALFLGAQGSVHFKLQTACNIEGDSHPSIALGFDLDAQSFFVETHHLPSGVIAGAWQMSGDGFGQSSLADIIISAMHKMNEKSREMVKNNLIEYAQPSQNICYGVDVFLDIIGPIATWEGIMFHAQGSFDFFQNEGISFLANFDTNFRLETYDKSWGAALGSRSSFSYGIEGEPKWTQFFIINDPVYDIEKIACWIQLHCTDKLSTLLNMPSIKYYSDYFPKYFVSALTLVMIGLGEQQEDGTVQFKMTSGPIDSFDIGGVNINEAASLFVIEIKKLIGNWWH